jgi:hypothetical protein
MITIETPINSLIKEKELLSFNEKDSNIKSAFKAGALATINWLKDGGMQPSELLAQFNQNFN